MHFLAAASQQIAPSGGGGACWEGVMTVGTDSKGESGWGFSSASTRYGSITNEPVLNCQGQSIDRIFLTTVSNYNLVVRNDDSTHTVGEIEIDGVVYNMGGNQSITVATNPFPPVGETCLIRILS